MIGRRATGSRPVRRAGGGLEDRTAASEEAAHAAALWLLESRARTRLELRQRLERRGFEAEAIERALDRLTGVGLVDDEAFARDLAASRVEQGVDAPRSSTGGSRHTSSGGGIRAMWSKTSSACLSIWLRMRRARRKRTTARSNLSSVVLTCRSLTEQLSRPTLILPGPTEPNSRLRNLGASIVQQTTYFRRQGTALLVARPSRVAVFMDAAFGS